MSAFLFANNAQATLASPITNTATTIALAAGSGVLFPSPGAGQQFAVTLIAAANPLPWAGEIVYCTSRSGDTLTVVRGQEGTTAQSFLAGDFAWSLPTAGQMSSFAQSASLSASFYEGTDSGSANAVNVATFVPAVSVPTAGQVYVIVKGSSSNSGAVTIQNNGGTAYSCVYKNGSSLNQGDWPAASAALLYFNGSVYQYLANQGPTLNALNTNASFYVNESTGNDSNNGSSGTPWATIQHALNVVSGYYLNNNTVTINVANGTYGALVIPQILGGTVDVVGNTATPSDCAITTTATNTSAVVGQSPCFIVFEGFVFQASGSAGSGESVCGVFASGSGVNIGLGNVAFDECTTSYCYAENSAQIVLQAGAAVTLSAGLTGSGASGFQASFGASITSQAADEATLTITQAITVGTFISASSLGSTGLLFSSVTGASYVTGYRYNASTNGIIQTLGGGADYYPGSEDGVTSTGGQYA